MEFACTAGDPSLIVGSGRCWRRERLPTPVFLGFPCGSAGKEPPWNAGDLGSIPGLCRSPGEGKGYPLQYSSLENSMDCIVRGVAKSRTSKSDWIKVPPLWPHLITSLCSHTRIRKIPWRRKWQPTPAFPPGKSHGQRSLAGYSPWDHKSRTWLSY